MTLCGEGLLRFVLLLFSLLSVSTQSVSDEEHSINDTRGLCRDSGMTKKTDRVGVLDPFIEDELSFYRFTQSV